MKNFFKILKIGNRKLKIHTNQSGQAMMISVVFFLFVSLSIVLTIVTPINREFKIASLIVASKQAYFLAESGSEDAFYRIKNSKQISSTETMSVGSDSATTSIVSIGNSEKDITALGASSSSQRKVAFVLKTGDGVVFRYGTQAGQGGFNLKNNAVLNGNIYSNGNIVGSNGAAIKGDAFVAGSTGSISNMNIGDSVSNTGDAHAHTVTGSTIYGSLYCQSGSSNNKTCNTSQADPSAVALPITDTDITDWKNDALAGGVTNGNVTISTPTTLGPRKIVGNLTVNSTLTLANTLWVTGNITFNANVNLASSFGANSGIIVSDGYMVASNGISFNNSGSSGSYIMILSTSSCDSSISSSPCSGHDAIEIYNNSNIVIANAQNGTVSFSNNSSTKEAVGNKITLKNNAVISYGSGTSADFSSGTTTAWNLASWKETQ